MILLKNGAVRDAQEVSVAFGACKGATPMLLCVSVVNIYFALTDCGSTVWGSATAPMGSDMRITSNSHCGRTV